MEKIVIKHMSDNQIGMSVGNSQNKGIIDKILRFAPGWSIATAAAFIMWLGNSGQSLSQVTNNPAVITQKIEEFQVSDEKKQTQTAKPPQTPGVNETKNPETQENFNTSLGTTLKFEGGYVNDPKDRGGETNFGITRRTYERFLKQKGLHVNINMRNIPQEHIEEIYNTMYWQPSGCHELPLKIAQQVFDFAVNSGVSRAVQSLQSIVGTQPDGDFGPQTKAAVEQYIQKNGEESLAKKYVQIRRDFVQKSTKIHRKFKKGLLNRINAMEQSIGTNP